MNASTLHHVSMDPGILVAMAVGIPVVVHAFTIAVEVVDRAVTAARRVRRRRTVITWL